MAYSLASTSPLPSHQRHIESELNLDIKPKAGDLYIFPSTYLFSHRAMPVESGMKFSVVTMLDYNDHAHRPEFMQMRSKWIEEDSSAGKNQNG